MHIRLTANTIQEIDDANSMLVFFCVPKDTVEIRQNIRGLITTLHRTRYYINEDDSKACHYTSKALEGIEVYFMCEESLNRGVNSLVEIEFTLKHLLAQMADKKDIQFFIDKPAEPALTSDGIWDMTDNKSIETGRTSNLEVGSLLETNSITDVLKIALLDDGTIGLPDTNPFNLESKLDDIRTDIYESKTHFLGGFTDLVNWFAGSFREGPYVINNPLFQNTFYNIFTSTFNKTTKQSLQAALPNWVSAWLPGWISSSTLYNYPFVHADESYIKQANDNFVTTFNETNTDGVASNSYFRLLHTWLGTDWKLFHDVMSAMKDCICAIETAIGNVSNAINGLDLIVNNDITNNPTNNITNNPTNNITNNPTNNFNPTNNITCECDTGSSSTTTTNTTTTTTTTTVNNPNGSTTTTTNTQTTPIYPPIDPADPSGATTQPYTKVSVATVSNHDAICGFIYYTMSELADWVEWLIGWLDPLTPIISAMGINAWASYVITLADSWGGGYISKLGVTLIRGLGSKWLGVAGDVVDLIPSWIREIRDDLSCPDTDHTSFSVDGLKQSIIQFMQTYTGQQVLLDFVSYCIYLFYDYGLYATGTTNINMADYAQYCPCPTFLWAGQWSYQYGGSITISGLPLILSDNVGGNNYTFSAYSLTNGGRTISGTYYNNTLMGGGTFIWNLNNNNTSWTGTFAANDGVNGAWNGSKL